MVYILRVNHSPYPLGVFDTQEKAIECAKERLANDERYATWNMEMFSVMKFDVQ